MNPGNPERVLISKVAQSKAGASDLAAEGFSEEHFWEEDCRAVWNFILKHTQRYGRQPTVPTIMKQFPDFNFEMSEEPLSFLKDEFILDLERRLADEFSYELAKAAGDANAGSLGDLILERGREIKNILPGSTVARLSDAERRIIEYEERVKTGDQFTGRLPCGIPVIDEATLGFQRYEMVVIAGWQGTGKSTLAQWFLLNFYLRGERCMFISLEMTADALMRKWDQMLQKFVSYNNLKQLNLSDDEIRRWKEWAKEAKEKARETGADILAIADGGKWTPERIQGEIVRHKPTVVVVDYITLMDTNSSGQARWERVTQLTRQLKEIAMSEQVLIVAISQSNRDSAKSGATLDTLSASYSVGADSDITIGLHQDEEMRANKRMQVSLEKNRDGERVAAQMAWDMTRMEFGGSFIEAQIRKTRRAHALGEASKTKEETEDAERDGAAASE